MDWYTLSWWLSQNLVSTFRKNMDYELYGCTARFSNANELTNLLHTHTHRERERERARDSYAYLYRPLIVPVRKSFTRNRTVAKQFRATKSLSGNCCLFICNSTRERSQHEATTTAMKGALILLCNWNEIHSGKIEIKSNKSQWHFANYAVNHGEKWDKHENYWS